MHRRICIFCNLHPLWVEGTFSCNTVGRTRSMAEASKKSGLDEAVASCQTPPSVLSTMHFKLRSGLIPRSSCLLESQPGTKISFTTFGEQKIRQLFYSDSGAMIMHQSPHLLLLSATATCPGTILDPCFTNTRFTRTCYRCDRSLREQIMRRSTRRPKVLWMSAQVKILPMRQICGQPQSKVNTCRHRRAEKDIFAPIAVGY